MRRLITAGVALCALVVCQGCAQGGGLNAAPKGYTSLFNGRNLAGWKGQVGNPVTRAEMTAEELASEQDKADELMRRNWKVEDDTLVYRGDGYDNLCTVKDYGDFDLMVDWKIKPGSDSGLYLRGYPQVQIWDPARAKVGSGGLYNNKQAPSTPLKTADRPAGEWNTFRIIMIGEWVIVYLNDVLVVNAVPLENLYDREQQVLPTGPIELQAHATPVYFRNIFIREIE